jgi:hypothetical protein
MFFFFLFSFFLGTYLKVELLSYMMILCLILLESTKLFSKVATPYYILTSGYSYWICW